MAEIRIQQTGALKLFENDNTSSITIASPSSLSANRTVTLPDADVDLTNVGGKIGQVVSATKTDKTTSTGTSFTDISGLSVSITPAATSSKILVIVSFTFGTTTNMYGGIRLMRDSTAIGIGGSSGSRHLATAPMSNDIAARAQNTDFNFLDSSNTTSSTTFKVQAIVNSGQTLSVNSSGEDENNSTTGFRYISTITAMEVLA